ncbi:hypothetical protein AMAG_18136 [Allomyces macrogynus ATCC 38327]|uniref:Uncharacterized protein n=1 Tax=Allomyces macrogynus (strain ATCC 38327) TaxID=578462 RepID=A0A0L0SA36_ALLM3|nr:hypothetical protein AMAG_18136 [Allomyces macrogynus ATCC 38327]|eukprot:KNE59264.1 hypothetical protein AMAG_18136 [Allomyces macrogynus ATCC 38327]
MALASLDVALYDLEMQLIVTVADWVSEWSEFCVFATLNWFRLVHFFTFLLVLQIATWTSAAVCIGVSYWVPFESPLVRYAQDYISRSWTWYLKAWDWWSPSDLTTTTTQPPLHRSDAPPHVVTDQEGGPVLYASMHQLLWRSWVLLFFGCAVTLSAVIIEEVNGDIDPLWFLISVAMAVRLRLFCSFFAHLNDMLKSRVRRGPTARRAAPHDAHLRSPRSLAHLGPDGGCGGRDTSMASMSTQTLLVPGDGRGFAAQYGGSRSAAGHARKWD